MIIDAFANYLRKSDPELSALVILARWLWENLTFAENNTQISKVLKAEIAVSISKKNLSNTDFKPVKPLNVPVYLFSPKSPTRKVLLQNLYDFCLSYEHQKWSRFIHHVKASDFNY